jgi:hypothetical protein
MHMLIMGRIIERQTAPGAVAGLERFSMPTRMPGAAARRKTVFTFWDA